MTYKLRLFCVPVGFDAFYVNDKEELIPLEAPYEVNANVLIHLRRQLQFVGSAEVRYLVNDKALEPEETGGAVLRIDELILLPGNVPPYRLQTVCHSRLR
jgi:hypothetical protein